MFNIVLSLAGVMGNTDSATEESQHVAVDDDASRARPGTEWVKRLKFFI